MHRVDSLDTIPQLDKPIGLTMGTFDGVHKGHQYLLGTLKSQVASTALLTFARHPLTFLRPHTPVKPLMTLDEKLSRLEACGLDLVIVLNFDQSIANLTYDAFLREIYRHLPFSLLVLGKGAAFGKGRAGTEPLVTKLGQSMGFKTDYLNKFTIDGSPVSSQRIRKLRESGQEELEKKYLG